MGSLTEVSSSITIRFNNGLRTLTGLSNLTTVKGFVEIYDNSNLTALSLGDLSEVEGSLFLDATALTGLSLASLTVVQGLEITNTALQSIAIPMLDTVEGSFSIYANPELTSCTADAVTQVTDSVLFNTNGSEADNTVFSMDQLAEVWGSIIVYDNPVLTELSGFSSLGSIGGDYSVYNNITLPTCEAADLQDQVVADQGIIGSVDITGNLSDTCSP